MASITNHSVLIAMAFALVICPLASAQAGSWEDCKTTKMVLRNTWLHNNIDVIAYSRLSAGQSVADCLAKCRANQECYSFNYNKVTKWCYLGTTEEINLRQTRNSKWTSGVRRCVEHSGNTPWTNEEYSGGSEGTAPNPVGSTITVTSPSVNTLAVTVVAPSTFGTTADGSISALSVYKVTCSNVSGSSAYPAVVASFTAIGPNNVGGLASGQTYSCTVVVVNTQGMESTSVTSAAVKVT